MRIFTARDSHTGVIFMLDDGVLYASLVISLAAGRKVKKSCVVLLCQDRSLPFWPRDNIGTCKSRWVRVAQIFLRQFQGIMHSLKQTLLENWLG